MKVTSNPAYDSDGLSDNDIDGFLAKLTTSLAREVTQNSNDAAIIHPVEIDFSIQTVNQKDIPGFSDFKKILQKMETAAELGDDKREKKFFKNAIKVASEEKIRVLTISDSKTTGVGGSFMENNPFFSMVRTKGTSSKSEIYSGGSFGIGKNAAFAASIFRTVFYSTLFKDNENSPDNKFYCMGKSILRSWKDNGNLRDRKVYWGNEEAFDTPITDQNEVPKWLRRDDLGLSIHIIGLHHDFDDDWETDFLATLIKNFYVAIYENRIQFSVGNNWMLNKGTLKETLYSVKKKYEEKNKTDRDLKNIDDFLSVLSDGSIQRIIKIENVGKFKFGISLEGLNSLSKKINIVRNGMLITENLKDTKFSDHLLRFADAKPFFAILQPAQIDDSSSDWLKKLEGPAHNELTTTYLTNEIDQEEAKKKMGQLTSEVRQIIKELATTGITNSSNLTELDKFVKQRPEIIDKGSEKEIPQERDPTKTTFSIKKSTTKKKSETYRKGSEVGGTKIDERGKKRQKKRNPAGPGNTAIGKFTGIPGETKVLKLDASNPLKRTLKSKKMSEDGEIRLQLFRKGRNGEDEQVKITNILNGFGTLSNTYLSKKISKNDFLNCEVELEKDFLNLFAVSVFKSNNSTGE